MSTKKTVRTLADFKAEHDPDVRIPRQIQAAITSLLAEGREAWEYEADFIRRCGPGVGNAHLNTYRAQFEAYFVLVKADRNNAKRVWFGDKSVAKKARGE